MSQRRPSVDELERLDGIGPKQVESSRPFLKTEGGTTRKQPLALPRTNRAQADRAATVQCLILTATSLFGYMTNARRIKGDVRQAYSCVRKKRVPSSRSTCST